VIKRLTISNYRSIGEQLELSLGPLTALVGPIDALGGVASGIDQQRSHHQESLPMNRGYLIVEGHGEIRAALNLVTRLWQDLGLDPQFHWSDPPIRGQALSTRDGIARACRLVRTKRDAAALLVLRDADDDVDCPKTCGPQTAEWIRTEQLTFPAAVVLFRREFETLFLPCLGRMAGKSLRDDRGIERAGLRAGTIFTGDFEGVRGVKEWLSRHFPSGRSYKPTLDQLPLTRMVDFNDLRRAGLP
jgi:hypothetical protein